MIGATVVYAFTLGLAATVNPCGFPLLPAYLAVFLGAEPAPVGVRLLRAFRASLAMTAGFVTVFAIVGIAVATGLRLAVAWVPWFTAALGLTLLVAGVFGVAGRQLRAPAIALPFRSGRGMLAMAGYGAAFATTSLGCAFPLFAAAVAPSAATGSVLDSAAAALSYALGMGLFVAACSILAALVGAEAVRVAGRYARRLPKAASALLLIVGIYLLAYGTRLILEPGTEPSLAVFVSQASGWLTSALSAHPLAVGAAAALVVLAALAAATAAVRSHRHPPEES
ncbi:cytochrome c biogenesis protein CcdA [Leifsonia soli]|uniref:Cytochrome c biogenesis protein CcdA n=1 Tax=Leifsonia soli TaxID=582665 RepID=A0A852T1Z4_9MICO|nr:cytochrome c biogenesis protein CcdA [Leifsonia soli]